jgi:hypothetical protein
MKSSFFFIMWGFYICNMNSSLVDFLHSLLQTLDQSVMDYKAYLSGGKTFHYARILKLNNGKALELLTSQKQLLPEVLLADAEALIEHYQVWTRKWEELATSLQPGPDDLFVFPNTVTFPRESASRLEKYYSSLIQP